MSIVNIEKRLQEYKVTSIQEEENAIKEITQEVILMALSRKNFFQKAVFHGGTCLRILHGLDRFSEDLDFALLEPDKSFNLQKYLINLVDELYIFGYELEVVDRSKSDDIVKKAFLKDASLGKQLNLSFPNLTGGQRKIKIKLEIDTNPPPLANTKIAYHNFPLPFALTAHDLPSLFAGKLHALLCREYVKGRDWYDLLWYLRFKVSPNNEFLKAALIQTGHMDTNNESISNEWIKERLSNKIQTIDWLKVREDIVRFIKPYEQESIKTWNPDFFLSVVGKMT